jgi:hypothetical protein
LRLNASKRLVPDNLLILGQCSQHVQFIVDVPDLGKELGFLGNDMMRVVGQLSDRGTATPRRDALGAHLAAFDLIT